MATENSTWHPKVFSAMGAGFKEDKTVTDGVHLRWSLNPKFGLPTINKSSTIPGINHVHVLKETINGKKQFPLSIARGLDHSTLPAILKNKVISNPSQLVDDVVIDNKPTSGFHFKRALSDTALDTFKKFYHFLNDNETLIKNRLSTDEQHYIQYLTEVHDALYPILYNGNDKYELNDVVACDFNFSISSRIIIQDRKAARISRRKQRRSLKTLEEVNSVKKYLEVKGFNRNGDLLDDDWVGKITANGQEKIKSFARLRAPGIFRVEINYLDKTVYTKLKDFSFLFCDDYCNADIWRRADSSSFVGVSEVFNSSYIQRLYGPFKKKPNDLDRTTELIKDYIIEETNTQEWFKESNTYDQYAFTIPEDEEQTSTETDFDTRKLKVPFLEMLLAASADPLIARLIGLYEYPVEYVKTNPVLTHQTHNTGTTNNGYFKQPISDYKIQYGTTFFHPENIDALRVKLNQIMWSHIRGFNAQAFFDFKDHLDRPYTPSPCGLVLLPIPQKHEQPEIKDINLVTKATDIPIHENENLEGKLVVQSKIHITLPEYSPAREPWRHAVSYELFRKLENEKAVNTLFDPLESKHAIDELGILPPVVIPQLTNEEFYLSDYFNHYGDNTQLGYATIGYDLFGRPSLPAKSNIEKIEFPCYEPHGLLSTSIVIDTNQGSPVLNTRFALSDQVKYLSADPKTLEVLVYEIPVDSDGDPLKANWVGNRYGYKYTFEYKNNSRNDLHLAVANKECVQLSWIDEQLNSNATTHSICETLFDGHAPVLTIAEEDSISSRQINYLLQHPLGPDEDWEYGKHKWVVKMHVNGECPNGHIHISKPVSVSTQYRKIVPPPVLQQPPLDLVPTSTFPDKAGQSFFTIDLSDVVTSGEPMLQLYKTTLTQLTDELEEYVSGDYFAQHPTIIDGQTIMETDGDLLMLELAKQKETTFELINTKPYLYSHDKRFYDIAVDGNAIRYHVIAVTGVNEQLQRADWSRTVFYIFKTPEAPKGHFLDIVSTTPGITETKLPKVDLLFSTDLPQRENHAPTIHIMRKDLTTKKNEFLQQVEGVWSESTNRYEYDYSDDTVENWRQYEYQVQQLTYSDQNEVYLKTNQKLQFPIGISGHSSFAPIQTETEPTYQELSGQQLEITYQLTPGDFNIVFRTYLESGDVSTFKGKIQHGVLTMEDVIDADYTIISTNDIATLKITISIPEALMYSLRVGFGSHFWIQKLNHEWD